MGFWEATLSALIAGFLVAIGSHLFIKRKKSKNYDSKQKIGGDSTGNIEISNSNLSDTQISNKVKKK